MKKTLNRFTKSDIGLFMNALEDVVEEEVLNAEKSIRWTGFGTFKLKKLPARTVRNPKSGEMMHAVASKKVQFEPFTRLKTKIPDDVVTEPSKK